MKAFNVESYLNQKCRQTTEPREWGEGGKENPRRREVRKWRVLQEFTLLTCQWQFSARVRESQPGQLHVNRLANVSLMSTC